MDCSCLKKGMIVRSYREMCALLGENEKTGNAKAYQIKNWERYFEYQKEGYKFCITQIYDKPLEKSDGRAGRIIPRKSGETIDLTEPLLVGLLCDKENKGEIILPRVRIYQALGMLNCRYVENNVVFIESMWGEEGREYKINNADNKDKYYIDGVGVANEQLLYFYEIANIVMASSFRSSLESMKKRGFLEYGNRYEIKYKNGKVNIADIEEMKKIKEIQQKTLEDMGIGVNKACLLENRREYYYKRNNSAKAVRNWERIFDVLRIALTITEDELAGNPRIRTLELCSDSPDVLRARLNGIMISRVSEAIRVDYAKYAHQEQPAAGADNKTEDNNGGFHKRESNSRNVRQSLKTKVFSDPSFFEVQRFLAEKMLKI